MNKVLHLSFRVGDPARSAALFAELLEGTVVDTPLARLGVVCVALRDDREHWIVDMLELWPANKHWVNGELVKMDPSSHKRFGHVAFVTRKSFTELSAIAERYGLTMGEEPRGMEELVPVLYDEDGNYFEFFPAAVFEALGWPHVPERVHA